MDDEQVTSGISRRSALKRIGAGAAIAWSAPVLMSINSRASAASDVCGGVNPCFHCGSGTHCHEGPLCLCSGRIDGGGCYCGENTPCGHTIHCDAEADCATLGPTWHCVPVCGCGSLGQQVCVPECGTVAFNGSAPTDPAAWTADVVG